MRYRGGGVGHRSLWPLYTLLTAEGHLRNEQEWTLRSGQQVSGDGTDNSDESENGEDGEPDEDDVEIDIQVEDSEEDEEEREAEEDENGGSDEEAEHNGQDEVEYELDEEFDEVEDFGYHLGNIVDDSDADFDHAVDF